MECSVRVRDVMSTPPITVSTRGTVGEAAKLMSSHGVGSVIIVEGTRPVGIFTEKDLVRCVAERGAEALGLPAIECGSTNLLVFDEDDCIIEAFYSFSDWGVRHAPVVDEQGRLAGVIALKDIAYKIVEEPDILLDLLATRTPEVSRDALYLLIKGLSPGRATTK